MHNFGRLHLYFSMCQIWGDTRNFWLTIRCYISYKGLNTNRCDLRRYARFLTGSPHYLNAPNRYVYEKIFTLFIFLTPRCYLVRQVKESLCHPQTGEGEGGRGGSVPNKSFIRLYLHIQIKFGKHSASDSKNHRPQVMSKISPRKKLSQLAS